MPERPELLPLIHPSTALLLLKTAARKEAGRAAAVAVIPGCRRRRLMSEKSAIARPARPYQSRFASLWRRFVTLCAPDGLLLSFLSPSGVFVSRVVGVVGTRGLRACRQDEVQGQPDVSPCGIP